MRYGFFNSEMTGTDENGMPVFDRAEQADFFAKYFSSFVRNGVTPDSFEFKVSGHTVTLAPGVVFINGYFGWESVETSFEIGESPTYIAARLNLADRTISLVTKTDGSQPIRDGNIYELYLYCATMHDIGGLFILDYRPNDVLCGHLGVANPRILCGIDDPSDDFGENGDIYIMY